MRDRALRNGFPECRLVDVEGETAPSRVRNPSQLPPKDGTISGNRPSWDRRCLLAAGLLCALVWGGGIGSSFATAQETGKSPEEFDDVRRVYVPYEELSVLVENDRRGVLLPNEEFERLYEEARRQAALQPRLPADAILSSARYEVRPVGKQLQVSATLEFTQFIDGWRSLSVPLRGLSVEEARLNDRAARLGRLPQQPAILQLLNDEAGEHTLRLELSADLANVGSDQVGAFGLPPVASGTLTVTLPPGKHLHVNGLMPERPAPVEEEARYELAVGGWNEVRLQITDRQDDRGSDALLFATTGYGLDVTPGHLTWQAVSQLQVYGQPIDRLTCTVPSRLEISEVESTGLESWALSDHPDDPRRTVITLAYRQPFDGSRSVRFRGVMSTESELPWTVPQLELNHATSHVGRVLVRHQRGMRLQPVEEVGVRRSDVPDDQNSPEAVSANSIAVRTGSDSPALLYDVWQEDFTLSFLTQLRQQEVLADLATILDVRPTGLELELLATVETLYAPLFELEFSLPAEWTLTAVNWNGNPADWQARPILAGVHQVRIPLPAPLEPGTKIPLSISARRDFELRTLQEEGLEFELPEVRLPQAGVVEGTYLLKADDDFDLVPLEITGLDPVYLNQQGERAGYRYQDTRFSGRIRVVRTAPRISARSLIVSRVDPDAIRSHVDLQVDVSQGSLRTLQIAVPASARREVRFQLHHSAARINEQQASSPSDGERIWTLQLDRPLRGELHFTVSLETPRTGNDALNGHRVRLPEAERHHGHLAIEAEGDQRLEIELIDGEGRSLPNVDPVDLPATRYVPRERIVAAARFIRPDYRLTLTEERFDRLTVPTAVCTGAELASILDPTGRLQNRAVFRFRTVGVQSLEVGLPPEANVWSALLDGEPIELRSVGETFEIPLPISERPDSEQTLELTYETSLPSWDSTGRLEQQPPRLAARSGAGSRQPLEMLHQQWTVHTPPDALLTNSVGAFQPAGPVHRPSLLGTVQERLLDIRSKQIATGLMALGIAAVGAFVLAWGYRRWGCLGMAVSAVVLLLGGVVLLIPPVQQARDAGMAYQVASEEAAGEITDWAGDRSKPGATSPPQQAPASRTEAAQPPDVPLADADFDGVGEPAEGGEMLGLERGQLDRFGQTQSGAAPSNAAAFADEKRRSDAEQNFIVPQPAEPRLQEQAERDAARQSAQPTSPPAPTTRRGRLSVAMEFEPPAAHTAQSFVYRGLVTDEASAGLTLLFQNRQRARAQFWLIVVAVTGCFWLLRNRSIRFRIVLAGLGLLLPWSLVTLVPVTWQMILDGLFVGSLVGCLLWGVHAAACTVAHWCVKSAAFRWSATGSSATRSSLNSSAVWLIAGILAGASGSAVADEPSPTVSKQQISEQRVSEHRVSEQPVSNRSPSISADSRRITVVIPYDAGSDGQTAERVFLPHETFLKLWNRAHPDRRIQAPAPVEGLVSEALYSAQLIVDEPLPNGDGEDGDEQNERSEGTGRISVSGRLVLHSFRDHQVTLPLPLRNVALTQASLNGEPAALVSRQQERETVLHAVLETAGVHVLDVQFDLPVERTGPAGRFALALDPVPSGRLSFQLPENDLTVRVQGLQTGYRLQQVDGQEQIELPIDRGGRLTLAWQPRQMGGANDVIVHAESITAARIADSGVHVHKQFDFQMRQGTISELTFPLSESIKIQQIRGQDVGGWELNDEDEQRTIRIFLRRPVSDSTRLQFDLYQAAQFDDAADRPVTIPHFSPLEITRETGQSGLFADPHFAIRASALDGMTQINLDQFRVPEMFSPAQSSLQAAYRSAGRSADLVFQVIRRKQESDTQAEHAVLVDRRKLRLTSRFSIELSGTPRSRIDVRLPGNFLPLDVDASHLTDWYRTQDRQGRDLLIVELDRPRTGQIELVLKGTVPKGLDDQIVEIDVPALLDVDRLQSQLAVWLDHSYLGTVDEVIGWRSASSNELSAELRQLQPQLPPFTFRSNAAVPGPVVLMLTRRHPRLTADAVNFVTVGETSVSHLLALKWRISQAAADTFAFTTPDWLSGRLEFTASGIRQIREEPLEDGRVRWIVTLHEPVDEQHFMTALATLPPATEQVRVPSITFEQPTSLAEADQFEPLETERQFVVLVNQSANQLTAAEPESLETVSAADLPIAARQSLIDQATEIVRVRPQRPVPSWQVTRFVQQEGAPASVNLADLTTVIAEDGSWRMRARYRLKNRSRQFLALRLSPEMRVLSVFVEGEPSRAVMAKRHDRLLHLIALPKTSEADLSFEIELILSGKLEEASVPNGLPLRSREIQMPAPEVLSLNEDEEFGIPVAQTRWNVFVPERWEAVPIDDPERTNLTPGSADLLDDLTQLKEARDLFRVLTGEFSGRQQYRAWFNVQKLDQKLKGKFALGERRPADDPQARELEAELQQFRKNLSDVQQRIQLDDSQQRVVTVDEANRSEGFLLDERELRRQLTVQNAQLFDDNTISGVASSQREESRDRFGLELKKQDDVAAPGRGKAGKASAVDRVRRSEQSISQLSTLNERVEQQRAATEYYGNRPSNLNRADMGDVGGIGGGMGGMGGMAIFPDEEMAVEAIADIPPGARPTGLSLPIPLAEEGQKLSFSKVGGSPQLVLAVRSRESAQWGFGLVWATVWLLLGLTGLMLLTRTSQLRQLIRTVPALATAIGFVGCFVAPDPLSYLAAVLFFAGFLGVLIQMQRRRIAA